jgi:hypothetical protein
LIWPGALIGLGLAVFTVGINILLAVNRLRACFILNLIAAVLGIPLIILARVGGDLLVYAWAIAIGQLLAGAIAVATASPLFASGWVWIVLMPPITSSVLAAGAVVIISSFVEGAPPVVRLCLSGAVYALVILFTLRGFFPATCTAVLSRLPGGLRLQGWLRLLTPSAEFS